MQQTRSDPTRVALLALETFKAPERQPPAPGEKDKTSYVQEGYQLLTIVLPDDTQRDIAADITLPGGEMESWMQVPRRARHLVSVHIRQRPCVCMRSCASCCLSLTCIP